MSSTSSSAVSGTPAVPTDTEYLAGRELARSGEYRSDPEDLREALRILAAGKAPA